MLEFIDWFTNRIDIYGPRKEHCVSPTLKQKIASLTATQEILNSPIGKLTDDEKSMRVTLFSMQISANTTVQEKVQLVCELYKEASGRNADLRREAPYIIKDIEYQYRQPKPGVLEMDMPESQVKVIRGFFDKEIDIISSPEYSPVHGR